MPHYTGGCLCGAVRIEIAAAPYRVGICHCLDCRKRQGAIFHSFAVFPMDAVTVTGETREFKNRYFCPTCGSPLFDRSGDEFELHTGCLDAPNQLTPTYESWVVHREAWLPPFDVTNRYERDRTAKGMDRKSKRPFFARAAAASPQPSARRPRAARRDTMLGAKAPGLLHTTL